jgi:V/A-type H+-transporting ATPase subunit I
MKMQLVELMMLARDVDHVLEYLGKNASFQMQDRAGVSASGRSKNADRDVLDRLQSCRKYLGVADVEGYTSVSSLPAADDLAKAERFIAEVEDIRRSELETAEQLKRITAAYDEARAFANLKVSYSELEHLTFLALRIGKIDGSAFDGLKSSVGDRAAVVALGEDRSRILAVSSKKGRFALDSELKKFGFVPLDVPQDFVGVPDGVLESLKAQVDESTRKTAEIADRRARFAELRRDELVGYLRSFSIASQVCEVKQGLEATQLVYRISGWIAESDSATLMKDLDELTEGRIAIRVYSPREVSSVLDGNEKVPVKYRHGPFVRSFERMVFSYGAPLYGTIDPTPVVAFFFTLLFGIMFGDVGQGGVFLLLGLALISGKFAVIRRWQHFGPIFVAIGLSSMVMGLLTGEVFTNSSVLVPFSRWITGIFGSPRDRILELMPTKDSIGKIFIFFGFTVAVGFIINSVGLIINIVNQFSLHRPSLAIFSKTGLCGAFFFWYVLFAALRIVLTKGAIQWFDIVCVVLPLVGLFFAEPLGRLVEGKRPILENGLFSAFIAGFVEILEVVSTYISNSVSFLRVGAFALSHAVLSYITFTMSDLVGGSLSAGGLAVALFGNAIIIVLEGLIVAIQVVRLQYYEFFSKFFTETGREFKPFRFKYSE